MAVYKFRVAWEEDDNIYRDIEIISGQTFHDFKEAILKSFEFDNKHTSSFFASNDKWHRLLEIDSEVTKNIKGAEKLSMVKTPVPALVNHPDEKFIFEYDPVKKWVFLITLIGISKDEDYRKTYPSVTRKEGVAPAQSGIKGISSEKLLEIEEKYDINREDMDAEGFGQDSNDPNFSEGSDDLM